MKDSATQLLIKYKSGALVTQLKTIEVLYFVQQKSDKLEQAVLTSISVVEVITLTISEEMRAHFEQIKA